MTDLLRFLHVLSASLWLGATLWVAGDVRRTLALGRPQAGGLGARVAPALGLDLGAGGAVVVTGLLLVLLQARQPRTGIMVGLALALGRIAVVVLGMRPAWRAVAERLEAGEDLSPADGAVKRMAMFSGIAHTLWLVALATMVFPI